MPGPGQGCYRRGDVPAEGMSLQNRVFLPSGVSRRGGVPQRGCPGPGGAAGPGCPHPPGEGSITPAHRPTEGPRGLRRDLACPTPPRQQLQTAGAMQTRPKPGQDDLGILPGVVPGAGLRVPGGTGWRGQSCARISRVREDALSHVLRDFNIPL